MERKKLELNQPWNERPEGTVVEVLLPGENPEPGCIDPVRAAAMIERGEVSPWKPPTRSKQKRPKGRDDG